MGSIEQQAITVTGIPKCMLLSPGGDYRCRVSLLLVRRKGVAGVASGTTEMGILRLPYYAHQGLGGPWPLCLELVYGCYEILAFAEMPFLRSVFTGVVFISERS